MIVWFLDFRDDFWRPSRGAFICRHKSLLTNPSAAPQRGRGIVPEMKTSDQFLPQKIAEWPSDDRFPVMNSTPRVRIWLFNQLRWICEASQTLFRVFRDLGSFCGTACECTLASIPLSSPPPPSPSSSVLMRHAYSCAPGLLSFQLCIHAFVTPISSVTLHRKANLLPFWFAGSITALLSLGLKLGIYSHTHRHAHMTYTCALDDAWADGLMDSDTAGWSDQQCVNEWMHSWKDLMWFCMAHGWLCSRCFGFRCSYHLLERSTNSRSFRAAWQCLTQQPSMWESNLFLMCHSCPWLIVSSFRSKSHPPFFLHNCCPSFPSLIIKKKKTLPLKR